MREHAPVYFHPPAALPAFWSLTRYEDIRDVYRDPHRFSSARGVLLRPLMSGDDPGGGLTLALTNPPRHRLLRSLIAGWFTERSARSLEHAIRDAARAALERAMDLEECDFAHDVAARLSLFVICRLMGVPEDDHEAVFEWTTEAFEAGRPLATHQEFMRYFIDLMDQRLAKPTEDLVSALVHATVNGEALTDEEILLNCENLVGATENAGLSMASGMLAFLEHPAEWRRLRMNRALLSTAVDEVLRWTSSATHSMRTATAPCVLHGQKIEPGDRVVLWIPSGNRDPDAFPWAERFDITRRPNRHLALGVGEHVCIGSTMARTQMRVLFSELLDNVGRIEQCGPVVPLKSIVVNGPARLPVRIFGS
ncbi:MAG: cytochrome P450 [Acidimicrobiales bacterium]